MGKGVIMNSGVRIPGPDIPLKSSKVILGILEWWQARVLSGVYMSTETAMPILNKLSRNLSPLGKILAYRELKHRRIHC